MKNTHLVLSQVDIRVTQALGSNSLLWKVITRFQVISGNHLVVFVSADLVFVSADIDYLTLFWDITSNNQSKLFCDNQWLLLQ